MKKKTIIILSTVFGVLFLSAGFVSYRFVIAGEGFRNDLNNAYVHSIGDFTEHLTEMETALEKSKYVSTPTGQSSVAAILRDASNGAKGAMSYLPFSENNSELIEKSISTVGDFALYIDNKSAKGETLTEEDYAIFDTLYQHVSSIKSNFDSVRAELNSEDKAFHSVSNIINTGLNLPTAPSFDSEMSDLSNEISSLPVMIYDGPYSDHIEQRTPIFLEGKDEITEEKALEIAADFADVDEEDLRLKFVDEGALAAYQFEGENISIKVTKVGGEISYFKDSTAITDNNLTYEEALAKALDHLEEAGYENLKESYYVINDNMCTINFAPLQEDVIMYPDLIKVTVELGEGDMMEFTSTGYLMNHYEREELIPSIGEKNASMSISESLIIENIDIAIVPTAGEHEALCYEFACIDEETRTEVLVYINGETGFEEQIFIVTKSDSGVLVK